MSTKTVTMLFVGTFIALCFAMVIDSRNKAQNVLAEQPPATTAPAASPEADTPAAVPAADVPAAPQGTASAMAEAAPQFSAVVAAVPSTATLGSSEPDSKYMFEIQFSSRGASISKVTLSRFKGRFDKTRQLDLLSPLVQPDGSELFSMGTGSFAMLNQKLALPLEQLDWLGGKPDTSDDGTQTIAYTASVKSPDAGEVIHLTKTYTLRPGEYHIDCDISVKNLSKDTYKARFDMRGPMGVHKEDSRQDDRKVVAAYIDSKSQVVSTRVAINKIKNGQPMEPSKAEEKFIWAAVTNKYFTTIIRPVPLEGDSADWIFRLTSEHYKPNPELDLTEDLSFNMRTQPIDLEPNGLPGSEQLRRFQIYFGPKDKSFFDSVPLYEKLGFMQTIDFMACCCPEKLIGPIAFGILALMSWAYAFIPDYGVIIILLVLFVRLILHPVTKKSQISMMGMSKLGPKAEEIKKQYANDKQEMNKRLMGLYKEAGISPFMGMLPMLVQMPIWIALYSAIYASIDLRGEPFHLLWFWIKDLSAPDAVLSWTPINLPLIGAFASLNILPMLLAVGMYLQQKLMPQQASSSPDSAMAQQQKMMLIMMPVMMLIFLYNAPSGLNLYIMASTFGGVIEQKVIRKHIKDREEQEAQGLVPVTSKTGGKIKKKKPKPFFKY